MIDGMLDAIKKGLPLREVKIWRYEHPVRDRIDFSIEFLDEYGNREIVNLAVEEKDWDFRNTDEWFADFVGSRLRKLLVKKWLRTRYDAWHIDEVGPDSLEEYIGMTIDEFTHLEETGEFPENWSIPV
jgi:hypothetical protein